ncbi:MAG TPA: STAS/SEC14 domain-containing protein [Burkholderiales bacterium]|nr:STAS/SEC14 domain-containing protein [Burkholderiales bacterium]
MISIQREGSLIVVGVFGELTLADYRRFEHEVVDQLQKAGRFDLLIDLRDMLGYTVDVVWEDIKFARSHSHDVGRIALLSDAQWVAWSAWLSQLFVDAEIRVFDDETLARAWLDGSEP